MISKQLPSDIEAEASILGALLLNPEVSDEVFDSVKSQDFSDERYRIVFDEMSKMWREDKALDLVVLRDELKKDNLFDRIGGGETLMELQDRVPSSANVNEYTRIVHSKGILRELIRTTQEILSDTFDGGAESEDLLDLAEKKIFDISANRDSSLGLRIGQLLEPVLERLKDGTETPGMKTGFTQFDELTNGLEGGQLIIVAGRPGVGKSTFVLNIVEHLCVRDNIPVGVFSLEMDATMIAQNILVMHSNVNASAFRKGLISKREHSLLAMGIDKLQNVPMFIDDTPEPGILKIRSRARRWCRRFGLKMIVVDYLQLLQGGDTGGRQINSRENEIAFISRSLKLLAKDLDVPIIAVSQLNRAVDSRTSKKPRLSDLRESGAIEQDADMVILISREDYYEGADGSSVAADINLAKNRTGPTGEFQLVYMKDRFKFDNFSARTEEDM